MKNKILLVLLAFLFAGQVISQSNPGFENWLNWKDYEKIIYVNRSLSIGDTYVNILRRLKHVDAANQLELVLRESNRTEIIIKKLDFYFTNYVQKDLDHSHVVTLQDNAWGYVFLKLLEEKVSSKVP